MKETHLLLPKLSETNDGRYALSWSTCYQITRLFSSTICHGKTMLSETDTHRHKQNNDAYWRNCVHCVGT